MTHSGCPAIPAPASRAERWVAQVPSACTCAESQSLLNLKNMCAHFWLKQSSIYKVHNPALILLCAPNWDCFQDKSAIMPDSVSPLFPPAWSQVLGSGVREAPSRQASFCGVQAEVGGRFVPLPTYQPMSCCNSTCRPLCVLRSVCRSYLQV